MKLACNHDGKYFFFASGPPGVSDLQSTKFKYFNGKIIEITSNHEPDSRCKILAIKIHLLRSLHRDPLSGSHTRLPYSECNHLMFVGRLDVLYLHVTSGGPYIPCNVRCHTRSNRQDDTRVCIL